MGMRHGHRLLVLGIVMAVCALLVALPVSAHAELKSSTPADKATLTSAPTQISLTFSEETSPTKSGGSVTDASGATVSTGFTVNPADGTKMTIALKPNLPNGVYTVKWNTLTEDDNGMVNGTFTFTVQAASGSAATATTPLAAPRTGGGGEAAVIQRLGDG
jgi:methionine-rich copper-binding protein CopC